MCIRDRPYGYMRSKTNPAQLIVDWNTAPIVKKIFQMKLDGKSTLGIAKELTNLGVPTPMQYWRSVGRLKSDNRGTSGSKWSHITVNDILRNPYYTGNCVKMCIRDSCNPYNTIPGICSILSA